MQLQFESRRENRHQIERAVRAHANHEARGERALDNLPLDLLEHALGSRFGLDMRPRRSRTQRRHIRLASNAVRRPSRMPRPAIHAFPHAA
jgi:hypothetical protein